MTNADVRSFECEKIVCQTFFYLPVADGFFAVQQNVETNLKSYGGKSDVRISEQGSEFICTEKDLEELKLGRKIVDSPSRNLMLFTPAVSEVYRRKGFVFPCTLQEEPDTYGLSDDDVLATMYPFTAMEAGLEVRVVELDPGSQTIHDPVGGDMLPLPIGISMDYIRGNLANNKYDLNKALEILSVNPNVRIREGFQGEKILRIEHYNAGYGRYLYINIIYSPDEATMRQIWQKAQSMYPKRPSTRLIEAMEELDTLGLRAGGALLDRPEGSE